MEKVKEIDVWLTKSQLESIKIKPDESLITNYRFTKAKLIIELPERKKEFTESEIREELDYFDGRGYRTEEIERIMEKLFGKRGEDE